MSKPKVLPRWTELLELEELLSQLMVSALKLPPGVDRRDSLTLIGSYRDRIVAMKWAEVNRFSTMQKIASTAGRRRLPDRMLAVMLRQRRTGAPRRAKTARSGPLLRFAELRTLRLHVPILDDFGRVGSAGVRPTSKIRTSKP